MSNENKKVGIRVLTLSGCDYCDWLKSELNSCGITYDNIDADKFSDFADQIEEKFKTKSYPIVFIESNNNITTIVPETKLDTSDTLRTFDTIPELVNTIKKFI